MFVGACEGLIHQLPIFFTALIRFLLLKIILTTHPLSFALYGSIPLLIAECCMDILLTNCNYRL